MYENKPVPVRPDITAVHREIWKSLGAPGTWWTSAQRIGIAREARRARAERGLAALPGEGVEPTLPEAAVAAARQIGGAPQTLDPEWFEGVRRELSEGEYVELAAVVVLTVSVDVFCRALGVELHAYPAPGSGEPERTTPAEVVQEQAWVSTVPNGPPGGDTAREIYGGMPMPYVIRALSSVPRDAILARRQCEAQYAEIKHVPDAGYEPERGLSRAQIELVAGRVSALNECFY